MHENIHGSLSCMPTYFFDIYILRNLYMIKKWKGVVITLTVYYFKFIDDLVQETKANLSSHQESTDKTTTGL